jgi:hypothetical protein
MDVLKICGVLAAVGLLLLQAPAAAQSASPAGRLSNISARGWVAAAKVTNIGANRLQMPFEVAGTVPKTFVVRAKGPSLAAYGISNALPDPILRIFPWGMFPMTVATNDGWQEDLANALGLAVTGYAPSDPREPAVMVTLQPGFYMADVAGDSGVALLEIFEVDAIGGPLRSFTGRAYARVGEESLISGFIIAGSDAVPILVRVRGPSLGATSGGALADPILYLVRASDGTIITLNDNWGDGVNASQIRMRGYAPPDPREPAILVTLAPGAYSVIVVGAGGAIGDAAIDIFALN